MFRDSGLVLKRRSDQIEALNQSILSGRGNIEAKDFLAKRDGLGAEVDGDFGSRTRSYKYLVIVLRKLDEQQSAVGAVLAKNIAVSRARIRLQGDHRPKSGLLDRPNGMLSGRATTKVRSDNQNGSALSFRPVQGEIPATDIGEEQFSVPRPAHPRKKSCRDDPVGIDIVFRIDGDFAGMDGEAGHPWILAQDLKGTGHSMPSQQNGEGTLNSFAPVTRRGLFYVLAELAAEQGFEQEENVGRSFGQTPREVGVPAVAERNINSDVIAVL